MNRVEIRYGGRLYTVTNSTVPEVQARIFEALRAGQGWLDVTEGEGEPIPAQLLITPGTPVGLSS